MGNKELLKAIQEKVDSKILSKELIYFLLNTMEKASIFQSVIHNKLTVTFEIGNHSVSIKKVISNAEEVEEPSEEKYTGELDNIPQQRLG